MNFILGLSSIFFFISQVNILQANAARVARIAGGQTVRENELPYMVQIGRGGDFHVCGGALIGERHVLTAAHCFNGFVDVPEEFSVTTGALNIDGTGGKNYTINKIIQHENYDSKLSDNDIAVIELSIAVDLNDESTQSVKLPVSDVSAITTATMSGWGQMGKNKSFSSKLLKLPVTTLNPTFCQDYIHQYKNEIPMADITSTVLCGFTNANNGFGTCTGDSGGPLVSNSSVIIGVLSSGIGDCADNGIDIYTNVYHYLNFIRSAMDQ